MRLIFGVAASRGVAETRFAARLDIIMADAICPGRGLAPVELCLPSGLASRLGLSLDCQPCCNDSRAAWAWLTLQIPLSQIHSAPEKLAVSRLH